MIRVFLFHLATPLDLSYNSDFSMLETEGSRETFWLPLSILGTPTLFIGWDPSLSHISHYNQDQMGRGISYTAFGLRSSKENFYDREKLDG